MSSSENTERLILIRLSAELTTKARGTRRRFTRKLMENIREALRETGERFHAESQWTRVYVRTYAPDAIERLRRIPGLSSMSVVEGTCAADLDEIVRIGIRIFGDRVRGRTYAVRAKRTGSHRFSSHDVQQRLGAALNPGATVDLDHPVGAAARLLVQPVHVLRRQQEAPAAAADLPLDVRQRVSPMVALSLRWPRLRPRPG